MPLIAPRAPMRVCGIDGLAKIPLKASIFAAWFNKFKSKAGDAVKDAVCISSIYQSPASHTTGEITVCGWVRSLRASKDFGFIELNDGSCFGNLQIVYEDASTLGADVARRLTTGCAIIVRGNIILTPDARQPFELSASCVSLEGGCDGDYPLQKKRHTTEYLRTVAHLRPRTNLFSSVFRIRSLAALAIHSFFAERGFIYVHTPLITASDCEGAGEMFRVTTLDPEDPPKNADGSVDWSEDFFGRQAALTVSGQLEGESFALAFGRIYTFGPTFRAENSNTARHAAEFWMIEPEFAFADLDDDIGLAWDMLVYTVSYVLSRAADEIDFLNKYCDVTLRERLESLVSSSPRIITYTKAVELLTDSGEKFKYPVYWGCDLQTEHERFLTEKAVGAPVFVTDYPEDIKAFYMRRNDDGKTVAAMDLLVPGVGELIGGSQREERYDVLLESMKRRGIDPEAYRWYTDLRRFGGARHAGFGLGFERLIMYLTGISNIRDAIPFPRTVGNIKY